MLQIILQMELQSDWFEMVVGGLESFSDEYSDFSLDNNNNVEDEMPLYIGNTGIDPSEVDNRLNSLFENSDPQTFRAQETSPSPSVDTEQNCPQKQRRSSVITTLKEASEGISIQPPQIQSKESENIYSTKEDTCQVLFRRPKSTFLRISAAPLFARHHNYQIQILIIFTK